MIYADLVGQFGSPSAAARALGVDRRQVHDWKRLRIPTKHQLKAAQLRPGALIPDAQAQREAQELAALIAEQKAA